jgi:hypothetical protein
LFAVEAVLALAAGTGCAASSETLSDSTGSAALSVESAIAGDGGSASAQTAANSGAPSAGSTGVCATPAEGCPCGAQGAQINCPGPKVHTGDYTSCADGVRTCSGGQWGACITASVVTDADQVSQDDVSPCPAGTSVVWGALTLDGLTPGDSSITVSAQSAATQASLDAATAVTLGTFSGAERTTWTSPDAQAAFAAAGLTSRPWIRVTLRLTAATTGGASPMVAEWREGSTCVAAGVVE